MTKASKNRVEKQLAKKIERRNLNAEELREYIRMVELVNAQLWKAMQIKSNTALVPNGIEIAAQEEAIHRLLDNAKNQWISQVLIRCGVPAGVSVNINSITGKIEEKEKELEEKIDIKVDEEGAKVVKEKKK